MKKLIYVFLLSGLSPLAAQAKNVCIHYDSGTTGKYIDIKFKTAPVPKAGSVALSGVAVYGSAYGETYPGYVDVAAIGLDDGTINYKVFSSSFGANPFYVWVFNADKKSFIGTLYSGFVGVATFVDCANFPTVANSAPPPT